jgi:hypothetical protein
VYLWRSVVRIVGQVWQHAGNTLSSCSLNTAHILKSPLLSKLALRKYTRAVTFQNVSECVCVCVCVRERERERERERVYVCVCVVCVFYVCICMYIRMYIYVCIYV